MPNPFTNNATNYGKPETYTVDGKLKSFQYQVYADMLALTCVVEFTIILHTYTFKIPRSLFILGTPGIIIFY